MSDSVDRVFVHALNTVKRIPRMGTTRPPPSDRLRLYGLYKQSMEGDVDGVLERPTGDGDEIRSDQEKWDSWNRMKGLSRTEAKRQYIATLIDTMHRYASNTPDARELVSELEFVWDQIKSNPPSPSSSGSYPQHIIPGLSPDDSGHSSSQPIYPVMSEHGARTPGLSRKNSRLKRVNPVTDAKVLEGYGTMLHDAELEEHGREEFVDAPDSQIAPEEEISQTSESSEDQGPTRQVKDRDKGRVTMTGAAEAAANLMAPITNYLRSQTTQLDRSRGSADDKWHKRIEGALIKMNTELAALREQFEMSQEADMHSSILRPFRRSSISLRKQGLVSWLFERSWELAVVVCKHIVIDAAILAVITIFLHYKGIPPERVEQMVYGWVRKIQQITFVRRLERMGQRTAKRVPTALPRNIGWSRPRS